MGVSPPWKTEYPDGCSTTIRCVVRKMGLYVLEMTTLWGCNLQTSGLAYDKYHILMIIFRIG